jgi:hypothetical protein
VPQIAAPRDELLQNLARTVWQGLEGFAEV